MKTLARHWLHILFSRREPALHTWSLHALRDIHAPDRLHRRALRHREAERYEQTKARLPWGPML